jgi:hypothetical protein
VLCGILLALGRIREQLERMAAGAGSLGAAPPAGTSLSSRPPAA